jgi:hypothetical protein
MSQPPVDIAHDALDRVEGVSGMRGILHRQHNAGDDHRNQDEERQRAEIPKIVEVSRRGESAIFLIQHREYRQTGIHPIDNRILEGNAFVVRHDYRLLLLK